MEANNIRSAFLMFLVRGEQIKLVDGFQVYFIQMLARWSFKAAYREKMKPNSLIFPCMLCSTVVSGSLEFRCTTCPRHRCKHPALRRPPFVGKMGEEVCGYKDNGKAGLFTQLHMRAQRDYPFLSTVEIIMVHKRANFDPRA